VAYPPRPASTRPYSGSRSGTGPQAGWGLPGEFEQNIGTHIAELTAEDPGGGPEWSERYWLTVRFE
jgi:hypothetical protein